MKQILENVRLASDVRDALTRHGGKLGHLLAYTLAYESGDAKTLDRCRIDGRLLREAYWRSIAQARTALRELYLQQVA
jgi:c-di-GMP-related signal transduction protein